MKWQNELTLAVEAVKVAGNYLEKLQKKHIAVVSATGKDVKLRADRESEEIILQYLTEGSPYPIITEETGEHGIVDTDSPVWIVDPLDGTVNFSRSLPIYCISVALWKGEDPLLGVVYNFRNEELFTGVVGEGAWCGSNRVFVSDVTRAENAILATGFPVNRDFNSNSLLSFVKDIQNFKKVRLLGSAALSLAYLASGKVDAYVEEDIMLWDIAAGVALVKAAGGMVCVEHSTRRRWAAKVFCAASSSIRMQGGRKHG